MKQSIQKPRGFTLIEVLIVVGIITLLGALSLVGLLAANKKAKEVRIKSDLALISTALEAYKAEEAFGDYPRFPDAATDKLAYAQDIKSTWLDYNNARGAVLLCRALIGPGPAFTTTGSPVISGDGADGPGFRLRAGSGKTYGYYVDPGKIKVKLISLNGSGRSDYVMLDINGNPILYYPGMTGSPPLNVDKQDPAAASSNATCRFNTFDNETFFKTPADCNTLAAECGNLPYLLWTSGADGQFGIINGKSDDVTNFDLPANLKK